MFAGNDFVIRQLLNAPLSTTSILPSNTISPQLSTSPLSNQWTLNGTNNLKNMFDSSSNILQDYSLTLQLLQLQMALQTPQTQPFDNMLMAALGVLCNNSNFTCNKRADSTLETEKFKEEIFCDSNKALDLSSNLAAKNSEHVNSSNIKVLEQNSTENSEKPQLKCLTNKQQKLNRKRSEPAKDPSSLSTLLKADGETNLDEPAQKKTKLLKKRLSQDVETNSPVSGMYIKKATDVSIEEWKKAAELDDTAAYVHISDESRKAIAELPNVIGDAVKYDDVFRLAMHRCPRIIHEEYRCSECDKVFSCPANLASHRRWHRPRQNDLNNKDSQDSIPQTLNVCTNCSMEFKSKFALKKHKRAGCTKENDSKNLNQKSNEHNENVAAQVLISLASSISCSSEQSSAVQSQTTTTIV